MPESQVIRSAPKGRQQMGETGFCKNLRFPAVSCENLRFPAVFCANLRLPNPLTYRASRKSENLKICENVRSGSGFSLLLSPFWRALRNCNHSLSGRGPKNWNCHLSGPEKGVITKGVFSLEKSLESLKSLNSLESLENGPDSPLFSRV